MAERTVAVRLEGNVQGYVAAMTRASLATKQFADKSSASVLKNERHLSSLSRGAGLAGLAVAAGVGVAVKSYADFDHAVSGVASTGADAKNNLDALRKAAIEAGAKTKFSATQAAQGQEALAKANVSAKDSLGGGLTGALNLAASGNLDVASSADVAATAMNQFKLQGKDVPHIADLLAASAGKAQGEVSDMAAALKQSGLVAAQTGLSIEETTGGLAAFASAGLIGSDAGTSFKTMLQALTPTSVEAKNLMEKLGISAYDAQGNFIGLADFADNLRGGLKDLSVEQQNAALKTIFGSDAVRAASVLYQQGGVGIRKWTDDVNDSGYAAQVAATKMDNLKGDLEQLRGSLETALIQSGKAGNVGLRSLTQGATSAVNAFGQLDPSIQSTTLGIGALTAGTLLSVAGVSRLAIGAAETYTAFRDLNATTPRLAAGLRGVALAAGAVGATLVSLQVVGAVSRQFKENFVPAVEESNAALDALGKGSTDELDKLFNFDISGFGNDSLIAANSVRGLGDAVARIKDPGLFAVGAGIDKITGTTGQLTSINAQFATLDTRLSALATGGKTDQAAQAFARLQAEFTKQGVPVEKLIELFPAYAQSVRDSAEAAGVTLGTASALADVMGGKLPPAMTKAGIAAQQTGGGVYAAAGAMGKMKDEGLEAKQTLDDLVDSLFAAGDAAVGLSDAQIGYEQAVAAASQAAKDNKKSTDLSTKAGQDQQAALNRLAGASHRYIEQLVSQGAKTGDVEKATKNARAEFIEVATAMFGSSKKAKELADKYGLIPKDVKTKTSAPGMDKVKSDVKILRDRIKNLPDSGVNIKFTTNAGELARAYNIGITRSTAVTLAKKGRERNLAGGGILPGYTPGRDVHRFESPTAGVLNLSGGEGILRPELTAAIGPERWAAANRAARVGRVEQGLRHLGNFAGGGIIRRINVRTDPVPGMPAFDELTTRLALGVGGKIGDAIQKKLAASAAAASAASSAGPGGPGSSRGGWFGGIRPLSSGSAKRHAGYPWASWAGDLNGPGDDFGDPVYAWLAGAVAATNRWNYSYGNHVRLNHGGGRRSLYAHLSQIRVRPGQRVSAGQLIGNVGETGNAFGAHLHWEGQGFAGGGRLRGPGSGTSDSIPLWGSNGEFMVNAKATSRFLPLLEFLNAQGLAAGGPVLSRAQGPDVMRLIAAIQSPLLIIAAAFRDMVAREREHRTARSAAFAADRNLDRAQDYRTHVGRRVNRLEAEARRTKGVTRADRELKKAREELEQVDKRVEARERQKNRAFDASREAKDRAADATRRLTEAQQQLADAAQQVSDQFSDQFRSTSTDVQDWIELMRTGSTDLVGFTKQLAKLRKSGLSETLVQQIIGLGAVAGGDIAAQIFAGGSGLVGQLNAANQGLQAAADALGYLGATGPKRLAAGGPVTGGGTGTSDSVPIWASNGEWVVPQRAVAPNRGYLEAITYGRAVVAHNYARSHYAGGGYVNARAAIDMDTVRGALAGMRIAGHLQVDQDRGWLEGVVVDVMDRETGKVATSF